MRVFRVALLLANGAFFAWACVMWIESPPSSLTQSLTDMAITSIPIMNLIYLFFQPRSALPSIGIFRPWIGIFRLWLDAKEAELKARAEIARASIKQDHKVP